MGLEKATLNPETGGAVKAMFNPKELSLSKSVPWEPQASTGADTPEQQFNVGQGRTLTFELFFDRFEENGSVAGDVAAVDKMTLIDGGLHRPPIVTFTWGSFTFKGVFKQIQVRYTMFLENGNPCRATVNCTMQEHESLETGGAGKPKNSPDHAKLRKVRRGETLHSIAATEYDDPGQWRRIADANGIDNPMDLEPGAELLVPPILNY
jgi:nucleoid-associated protein YgaU